MFRSPPVLRSRSAKDKETNQLTADKKKVQRSLSATSDPGPSTNPLTSTMPQKDGASAVSKFLAQDEFIAKMSAEIKVAVAEAVQVAMVAANEEIARLNSEVAALRTAVKVLGERLGDKSDEMEQYQRRNNLRIFGVPENVGEDTDSLVVKVCREKLGLELSEASLCRSHRVGKRSAAPAADGRPRHRPIIVRFISYRDRRRVFNAKKKLKGTGVTVREDLTAVRQQVYQQAVQIHGRNNTWTSDGRVLWVDSAGNRGAATRLADVKATSGDSGGTAS